jgi:hypothetical protein
MWEKEAHADADLGGAAAPGSPDSLYQSMREESPWTASTRLGQYKDSFSKGSTVAMALLLL